MTNTTTNRIAGLATLALAILPLAAVAGGAHAAPARILVADLDLNSPAGMAAFQDRARHAEDSFCRDGRALSTVKACQVAVRAEIADKLAQVQQSQLAKSTTLASR